MPFGPDRHEFLSDAWFRTFHARIAARVAATASKMDGGRIVFQEVFLATPPSGKDVGWRITVEAGQLVAFDILDGDVAGADASIAVDGVVAAEFVRCTSTDPRYAELQARAAQEGAISFAGDAEVAAAVGALLDGLHDEMVALTR